MNKKTKGVNLFRELGRMSAGSYYDHQQIRIAEMNRFRDIIIRKAEGLGLVEKQEKKKDKSYEEKYTDKQVRDLYREMKEKQLLSGKEIRYVEKVLKVQKNAKKFEKEYKKPMKEFVENEEIFNRFLKHIHGISDVLSANLIKEVGYCEKAPYISSLWKFFGMHVVDGKAPKRKSGTKLEFPLKNRALAWKIADSFIKQRTPFYRKIYDEEKKKQKQKEYEKGYLAENYNGYEKKDTTLLKGHAHNRAKRKMVKIFLAHYWQACKELKGQDKSKPYVEKYKKHKHISNWKEAVEKNKLAKEDLGTGQKVSKDKV